MRLPGLVWPVRKAMPVGFSAARGVVTHIEDMQPKSQFSVARPSVAVSSQAGSPAPNVREHPAVQAYVAAIGSVAAVVAFDVVRARPLPPAAAFALGIFALIGFASERTVLEAPHGWSISPGVMLTMAAVVALGSGQLAGTAAGARPAAELARWAALAAAAQGFGAPFARRRGPAMAVFHAAQLFLAGAAAASVFAWLHPAGTRSVPGLVGAALPAAVAYTLVKEALAAPLGVMTPATGTPRAVATSRVDVIRTMVRASTRAFVGAVPAAAGRCVPFAVLGAAFGRLFVEYGPMVIPLVALPIVIARQTFVASLQLRGAYEDTLRLLVRALEEKDRYTAGHASRVARYAQYIGEELGYSPARLERLRYAALMHDVGKLVVPNHLLNKPDRLTAEEYVIVRKHEEVSVEILDLIDFLRPVAPSALGDHHRYEEGAAVIEPHVVAVADAYDAMTSTRSYRRALPQRIAFAELRSRSGSQFHPDCVIALINALEARSERHGAGYETEPGSTFFVVPPPVAGTGSAGLGDLAPAPTDLRSPAAGSRS